MKRRHFRTDSDATTGCTRDPADLAAGIAGHAIELARLCLERGTMFRESGDTRKAVADKLQAEVVYRLAIEAARSANSASSDLLTMQLVQLRSELDSFEVSRGVGA